MSRNIRADESVLENVLSLVEALLQLSVEQDAIAPNKTDIVNRMGMRRRSPPQASFLRSPPL